MERVDAKSNFGKRGWSVIIYSGISFFFYGGVTTSSLNTVIPMQSARYGWDAAMLLGLATPASIVALLFCLLLGKLIYKKGVVFTQTLLLLLGGAAVIWWGYASSLTAYVIAFFLVVTLMNGIFLTGGNVIISNWFPRKKGLAIGWSSMGLNISSATVVAILIWLAHGLGGISGALTVFGSALILFAIVTRLFLKDFPEDLGLYPDNDPNSERMTGKPVTGWTTRRLLRSKEMWLISLGNGFYGMVIIGFISQIIPTLMERGIQRPRALAMIAVASLIGVLGSYICGYIDQKFGVKKSSVLYGIWVIIAISFYFVPNNSACLYIFVCMIGFALGGASNYPVSMTAQIYGRKAFPNAFPLINFINGVIKSMCFLVLALSIALTGSYLGGYITYAILVAIGVITFANMNFTPKKEPSMFERDTADGVSL